MTAFQTFSAGQILTAAQVSALQANSTAVAIFNDQKANGTNAGTASTSYATRTLNTTVVNNIAGCSLASNTVTLTAGSYVIEASAPAFNVNGHKIRIYNSTTSATIAIGSSAYSVNGNNVMTESKAFGYLTITGSTNIIIQHVANTATATSGWGAGGAVGGDNEVFAQIKITQVA
jgi:hypothetical protein